MFINSFYLIVVLSVIHLITPDDAARILCVFPVPSVSHQVVFRPLTQELARRGHELVILTTDPAFAKGIAPKNIKEIDLHDKSYDLWQDFMKISGGSKSNLDVVFFSLVLMRDIFEYQLKTDEVQNVLKNDRFDLIFVEALHRPALVLSHVFKTPVIQISSFGAIPPNYQVFGAPSHPLMHPELIRQRLHNLTLWEKIYGTYEDFYFRYYRWLDEMNDDEMLKRNFGPNTPSVSELSENVDMLFLNTNPIFEGIRAIPPGIIYMGGLHQTPQKELPLGLKTYLDESKLGVIYMSFGTNVNTSCITTEKLKAFNRVFSKLRYDILWKWDMDVMPGKAENVKISRWLPQSDLLRHPKIKLFITQAGLQSTDEAITAGVPLIAFPMLGDQWYNAEKYVYHDIGIKLDIATITEDTLETSIQTVITDNRYKRNIIKLRELMYDQPQTPLERAVWWTEYVIRHGGAKHLRSPAANISWTEYLMLDVVAVLAIIIAKVFIVLGCIIYSLFKCKTKQTKYKSN